METKNSSVIKNDDDKESSTIDDVHLIKSTNDDQQQQPSNNNNNNISNNNRLKYGRVVILLENPILPEDIINNTPSKADYLDPSIENDLRITGCRLIQISGILLHLPQVAMATGQVLFQRFYYTKSFVRQSMEITAMACVVLASKVEEAPRRIRDIINVFHNMKQIRLKQPTTSIILDENYIQLKNQIIKSERRILKELGFCVHVKHPHKFIVAVAQILKNENNLKLIQTAWSYMNDSLQTNVFVRYSPETIACACIHLSSRVLRVPLPMKPVWYEMFNVNTENIEDICKSILMLYTRKILNQEELESKVEEAKQKLEAEKMKQRSMQRNNVPKIQNAINNSPVVMVDSRSNSPSTMGKSNEIRKNDDKLSKNKEKINSIVISNEQQDVSDRSSSSSSSFKLQKSPIKSSNDEKKFSASKSMKRLLDNDISENDDDDDDGNYKRKSYCLKKNGHHSNNDLNHDDQDDDDDIEDDYGGYSNSNSNNDRVRLKKEYRNRSSPPPSQLPRSYVVSSKIINNNKKYLSRSRSRSPVSPSYYYYENEQYSSSSRHYHHYDRRNNENRSSSSMTKSDLDHQRSYDDEMKSSSTSSYHHHRYHHYHNNRRHDYHREKNREENPDQSSSRHYHRSYGGGKY